MPMLKMVKKGISKGDSKPMMFLPLNSMKDCNHKTKLMKLIAQIYFELRLYHESRCLNKEATYK